MSVSSQCKRGTYSNMIQVILVKSEVEAITEAYSGPCKTY